MVRKIRLKGIWPSAKLFRTIEINIASISMAICCYGSNRKEKQGGLKKVRQLTHYSRIHVVTNMRWKPRDGDECFYTGEVDQDGFMCGEGVAFDIRRKDFKYELTCL